jgi:transcriptional regulator of aromatic amino acid metabolism
VRELKNIIKQAVVMSEGNRIDKHILGIIGNDVLDAWSQTNLDGAKVTNLSDVLTTLEKEMLKAAKRQCRTTRDMAKFLNISQPSVIRKLKKYGIAPNLINKRIK